VAEADDEPEEIERGLPVRALAAQKTFTVCRKRRRAIVDFVVIGLHSAYQ
jgi:hypothetical protein